MAWVALYFILILFSIGFLSFLGALFFLESQAVSKSILGGIDTLLAWALKIILTNLFPDTQNLKK
jgi:hypothetical protein